MASESSNIQGLTDAQVLAARSRFGSNRLQYKKQSRVAEAVKSLLKEPMVLLLLVASTIYFVSGNYADGIFLAFAIVLVAAISLYQDSRSHNALEKLKNLTQPNCKVVRNNELTEIKTEELVIGDCLVVEEGTAIAADGTILESNDFSVNESILTGESLPVFKDKGKEDHYIYKGTSVAGGRAIAEITAIGNETRLGKIGKSLENIETEKTPLEKQINNFVKKMVIAGAVVFLIVWGINYSRSYIILDSLLKALTLAMSILPEEIPVAFTTFMALGAWRMMQKGVVVKQMKTVETLGSATVICTDKTGTITENKMSLARLYVPALQKITDPKNKLQRAEEELVRMAMFASEPVPFDPMETALHDAYTQTSPIDEREDYKMEHEYPLSGKPPLMTHIFRNSKGNRIIAAKGAPEALIRLSGLSDGEKLHIEDTLKMLASEGFRVLGVAEAGFTGENYPADQQEFNFSFKGLVAFYDPPKKNIQAVFDCFDNAGIAVKIVTGDNVATTSAIARQVGFRGYDKTISGDELMQIPDAELPGKVMEKQVFTRMFPEAKLKIIHALKAKGQIVAMTGDGVNDGPALKAAHIGIAMGKKGTEIAKQAASLILVDDDLSKMADAIAMGRKIYTNLKKAIRYIISIHIPIILTVFIPLVLGWKFPNIFSPVHIIFFELIMGPTCSIIYENEPIEKNTMMQPLRPLSNTFFQWHELTTSILQGLMITLGTLITYQYAVIHSFSEEDTRTMVFLALIAANILLTLVNRSFYYSIFSTLRYKNNLVPLIIGATIAITALLIYVAPLAHLFGFSALNTQQLLISAALGFASVIWFEAVKLFKRIRGNMKM